MKKSSKKPNAYSRIQTAMKERERFIIGRIRDANRGKDEVRYYYISSSKLTGYPHGYEDGAVILGHATHNAYARLRERGTILHIGTNGHKRLVYTKKYSHLRGYWLASEWKKMQETLPKSLRDKKG